MEKFLMAIGGALVALGVGFLVSFEVVPDLHQAFVTGGYLWTALGVGVIVFGSRVKTKKQQKYKSVV